MSKPTPDEDRNSASSPDAADGARPSSASQTPPVSPESQKQQGTPAKAAQDGSPAPRVKKDDIPSEDQPTQAFSPIAADKPAQAPAAGDKPAQSPAAKQPQRPEAAPKSAESADKSAASERKSSDSAETSVLPPARPNAAPQGAAAQGAGPQKPGQPPHGPQQSGPQQQGPQHNGPQQAGHQQPVSQPQGTPQPGASQTAAGSAPNDGSTAVMPPVGAGAAAGAGAAGAAAAGNTAPPPGPGAAGPGQPASGPGTIAAAPARPRDKKKSPAAWVVPVVAASVVVVLVIVGVIAHAIINRTVYGPDATAQKFVDALNEGDFAKARSYADIQVPENAYTDLIDDQKYAKASSDSLSDAQVTSSERSGDSATITVGYKLAGDTKNLKLNGQKDGKQGLFFDKWKFDAPELGTVKITAPTSGKVKVNGEEFKPSNPGTEYAVLPGTYELTTDGSKYLEAGSAKATVGFADENSAELKVEQKPTKALGDDVQKQINDRIKSCTDAKEFDKKGCGPLSIPKDAKPAGSADTSGKDLKIKTVKWDVKNPSIQASLDENDPSKGYFLSSKKGSADFKADSKKAGKNAWYLKKPLEVAPAGEFTIEGDKIKITKIYGW